MKKKLIFVPIILVFIIIMIVFISMRNNNIKISISKLNEIKKMKISLKKEKYSDIELNLSSAKNVDLLINHLKNDTSIVLVYYLYDNNKEFLKKGILHDNNRISLNSSSTTLYLKIYPLNKNNTSITNVEADIKIVKQDKKKISTLMNGFSINKEKFVSLRNRMASLANNKDMGNLDEDFNIKRIKVLDTMNKSYETEEYIVSDKESSKPIYMWYEDHSINFYSENSIALPKDSSSLFKGFSNLVDIDDLKLMDTSNVENMSYMFSGCESLSNISSLSYFDTSDIFDLSYMFSRDINLKDISSLASFDTRMVKNMSGLFYQSGIINVDALKFFDVHNVKNMNNMFELTYIKSILPLSEWNVSNVENMTSMFADSKLNDLRGVENWNTSELKKISSMFLQTKIKDLTPLKKWDVSNVSRMDRLFYNCINITSINPLKNWKTESLKDLSYAFSSTRIKDVDALLKWDTHLLEELDSTFSGCRKLENIKGLKNFKLDKVKSINELFYKTSFTDTTPLKNWDVRNVIDMSYTFSHTHISDLSGLSNWMVENIEKFNETFSYSNKIKNIEKIDNWSLLNGKEFTKMFCGVDKKPNWKGQFDPNGTYVK